MSLLLDALRRAGDSRGGGLAESAAERRGASSASQGADGGATDIPTLDIEPMAEDQRGEQPAGAPPSGPARAEAVFRGGAAGRPALRALGLWIIGAILGGGVLMGGAWYYYETARSEVDRELVRYTPEDTPSEPATNTAVDGDGSGGSGAPANDEREDAGKTAAADDPEVQSTETAAGTAGSASAEPAKPEAKGSAEANAGGTADEEATSATAAEGTAGASSTEKAESEADPDTGGASRDVKANKTGGDAAGGERRAETATSASTGAQADGEEGASAAASDGTGAATGRQEPMVRTSESGGRLGEALRSGYRALRSGDVAAAQRHYQRALELAPANRDARLGAAAVAQRQGKDAAAAEHYRRVLEDNPRDAHARAGLASVDGGGDPRRSESELKGLLKEDPDAHALRFSLGNLYAREGRWADAQSAYFAAFRDAPREADYAFNLAVALDRLGQRESAITYYERAVALADDGSASFPVKSARRRLDQLKP